MNLILIDMFRVSVKLQNTSGSLGEQELHWGRKPTPFLSSPKLDKYFSYPVGDSGGFVMLINSSFTENNLFTLTIKMYM